MTGVRETLVRLREQAGISQAELAKRLTNASASRISRIESGELEPEYRGRRADRDGPGHVVPAAKEFADYLRGDLADYRTARIQPCQPRRTSEGRSGPPATRGSRSGIPMSETPSCSKSSPAKTRSNGRSRFFSPQSTRLRSSAVPGSARRQSSAPWRDCGTSWRKN